MKNKGPGGLVYSTEGGRMCPQCRRPLAQCACAAAQAPPPAPGGVRIRLDSRRGKSVTLVTGLPLAADALAELGRQLRQRCGSGGTAKDGCIEIQGDHRALVQQALAEQGHKARVI